MEENFAFNKPAWANVVSNHPPGDAVDNNPMSYAYTYPGTSSNAFVGVDLGSAMSIGRVLIVLGWSKC